MGFFSFGNNCTPTLAIFNPFGRILLSVNGKVLWGRFTPFQWNQIGRFLLVFGNKLFHKSGPNILETFCALLIMSLICKKCSATFWAFLGKLGKLFYHLVTLFAMQKSPFDNSFIAKYFDLNYESLLEQQLKEYGYLIFFAFTNFTPEICPKVWPDWVIFNILSYNFCYKSSPIIC